MEHPSAPPSVSDRLQAVLEPVLGPVEIDGLHQLSGGASRETFAFTANGRALPCCIAPFSLRGYDAFTLGDATQQSLRDIWNGEKYRAFRAGLLSDAPPPACASVTGKPGNCVAAITLPPAHSGGP